MTDISANIKNQIAGKRRVSAQARKHKTFQNIVHTSWDKRVWDRIREHPTISEQVVNLYAGEADPDLPPYELGPELLQDTAYMLFKTLTRYERKINVHKSAREINRQLLEILEELPATQELREWTQLDAVTTTIASEQLYPIIIELLKHADDEGHGPPGGPGGDGPPQEGEGEGPPPPSIDKVNQQAKKDKGEGDGEGDEEVEGAPKPPDDLLDENERDLDEIDLADMPDVDTNEFEYFDRAEIEVKVNDQINDIVDELEALENTRKGIGIEDGVWESTSPEERLALARTLNTPAMKELANIVGRMKKFALGIKATRIIDSDDEITSIELGNDLRKVVRSEFAMLASKDTEYNFYRKYYDRELFQFRFTGEENAGKGPIVVAIDKSGSMSGNPLNWAIAVAEALRQFAQQDDRDFRVIFFAHGDDRIRFSFPKGKADIQTILNFLGTRASGGTEFDGVLNEALEFARQAHRDNDQTRADIVFITDGYAYLDEDWIKRFVEARKEVSCHLYSVFVGGAGDVGHYEGKTGPVDILNMLSDAVLSVHELTEDSVTDIFAKV